MTKLVTLTITRASARAAARDIRNGVSWGTTVEGLGLRSSQRAFDALKREFDRHGIAHPICGRP